MGRGRAPCCDKTQVVRGPWSPAEDIRLISYIQKYGHDNWRALPKQAGLLRCGKSCRLRWINYLRPDLKRGNFTMQEEDAIIQLHQTIGNKWSKIAAHFPGRTDNEIKNVWNTHLKKRLSKKAGAESKREETSAITSSSSSSTTTAESSVNSPELGIKSQISARPKKDKTGPAETTVAPKSNQEQQSPNAGQLNNFCYSEDGRSEQLLDSGEINQVEEFTDWGDPNLLESLLSAAAGEPEWGINPQTTRFDSSENDASGGINIETDIDLWNMLNNADQPAAPAHEYMSDREIDFMFDYMDNEPGLLAPISTEMHGGYVNHEASMDYFPLWPHSRT